LSHSNDSTYKRFSCSMLCRLILFPSDLDLKDHQQISPAGKTLFTCLAF
jgi:hypothetical protein